MKTIIIFAICVTYASSSTLKPEQKATIMKHIQVCGSENNMDPVVVADIVKGGEIKHTHNYDCFASCVLKKMGIQLADGTVNSGVAHNIATKANIDIHLADEVINNCKTMSGKDSCETGGLVFTCFIRNKKFPIFD